MGKNINYDFDAGNITSMIAALFKTSQRINLNGTDVVIMPEKLFDALFPYVLNLINNEVITSTEPDKKE